MAVVYDVIVTSLNTHFSGIEGCEKHEISGLQQHALLTIKSYQNFSQNQKGFGCIVAAVLLILSSKELI